MESIKQLETSYESIKLVCEGEEYNQIEEFATYLEEKIRVIDGDKYYDYNLMIETIDGLKCDTKLRFGKDHRQNWNAFLNIESKELLSDNEDFIYLQYFRKILYDNKTKYMSKKDIMEVIMKTKYLLSNLKYCYVINELTLTPDKSFVNVVSIFSNPNIKFNYNQCCVCLNGTTNITRCKHSLCYKCWEQIKVVYNEEEDIMLIPCPLCRANIKIVNDD